MSALPNQRALVLERLLKGRVEHEEAALLLGLSDRSIRRHTTPRRRGSYRLAHGNSGRHPAHASIPRSPRGWSPSPKQVRRA